MTIDGGVEGIWVDDVWPAPVAGDPAADSETPPALDVAPLPDESARLDPGWDRARLKPGPLTLTDASWETRHELLHRD